MVCTHDTVFSGTLRRAIPCVLGLFYVFYVPLVHGFSQEEAISKLARARINLSISEDTEARIAARLDSLKQSGTASPEVIRDYEIYLDRVHRMVVENRKIVQEMEAALGRYESRKGAATPSDTSRGGGPGDQEIPEAKVQDEAAVLDGEFYASLAAFDEMLLKELDEIRAKSAGRMKDLATEAAEAAQRVREQGVEVDTTYQGKTQEGESEKRDAEGEQQDSEGERAGSDEASGQEQQDARQERATEEGELREDRSAAGNREYDRKPGPGKSGTDTRKDRPPAYDDDIVARQIREAAERETDPELKERLWKEYDKYKSGKSQ